MLPNCLASYTIALTAHHSSHGLSYRCQERSRSQEAGGEDNGAENMQGKRVKNDSAHPRCTQGGTHREKTAARAENALPACSDVQQFDGLRGISG